MKKKNRSDWLKKQSRNLVILAQLSFYTRIALIGNEIDQFIEARDDREQLFIQLARVLAVSNKLNKALLLAFQPAFEEMLNELKELKKFRQSLDVRRVEHIVNLIHRNLSIADS